MKRVMAAAAAMLALTGMQAPPPAPLKLWRLDCGTFLFKDFGAFFSDTYAFRGTQRELTSSCYLIRHGERYMVWDTGIPATFVDEPQEDEAQRASLGRTLVAQLAELEVKPEQVEVVGISHYHFDHIGQAAAFPKAKLVIGKGDLDAMKAGGPGLDPARLAPWIGGGAPVEEVTRDLDVFGDGSVVMLDLPGHTPGHHALMVRLASGPVLLTGDLYHFTEHREIKGVPPFNTDRADTLASMDRFDKSAANLGAKVIIQHEPADIAKLPAFPEGAE
jgi:N-acyl homoserine lactone hydrolase